MIQIISVNYKLSFSQNEIKSLLNLIHTIEFNQDGKGPILDKDDLTDNDRNVARELAGLIWSEINKK